MTKRQLDISRNLITSVLAFLSAVSVYAGTENRGDQKEVEVALVSLLGFLILLLTGIVLRMRRLRVELDRKTTALKKSEQHIRLMGTNIPNVTIFQLTYSEEGEFRFTYLSEGFERMLGFKRERIMEDAALAYDQVLEEDTHKLIDVFRESRKSLSPAELELRVIDSAGQMKWLHLSAAPHEEQGDLIWDGFIQDISIIKGIEDNLIEENRNFQNLFETIDDFLIVCDMDGKLIHINPSVIKRLQYPRSELQEMSIFELCPDSAKETMYQLIARMQTEQSTICSQPLQTKSGNCIPVEMNIFQGTWRNNRAIFSVARDVALRQQTESALRESQNMLQLIMDTIPMAVFWKDKDSVYLGCNKTFIHDCGLESIESVVGQTPYDIFDPSFAPDVVERDQEVIANNQPFFNFLQAHTRPDGTTAWREISKIPLRNESGRAVGVLGVWRDVTEQSHAEERLKRTLEDMERFNQLMRGRERRTLELKSEINALLRQLGQPKKYRTTTDDI